MATLKEKENQIFTLHPPRGKSKFATCFHLHQPMMSLLGSISIFQPHGFNPLGIYLHPGSGEDIRHKYIG